MELPRPNKLMIQYLSSKNGVLRRGRAMQTGSSRAELTDDDILAITGICRETPKNWRRGKKMNERTIASVFQRSLAYLEEAAALAKARGTFDQDEYDDTRARLLRFQGMLNSDSASIYEVAETLGMSPTDCQMAIESVINQARPLLPSVYYDARVGQARRDRTLAEEHLRQFEGLYYLWVRRDAFWLQCPLRVRALQPCGDGLFIRCKMNFPILDPAAPWYAPRKPGDPPYWEYDGVLTVRERHLSWCFDRRRPDRSDYFQFITKSDSDIDPRAFVLSGQYLTTGQDREQTIITGDALLIKLFSAPDDPLHRSYRDVMESGAKVLSDPKEIEEAERCWQTYGSQSGTRSHVLSHLDEVSAPRGPSIAFLNAD